MNIGSVSFRGRGVIRTTDRTFVLESGPLGAAVGDGLFLVLARVVGLDVVLLGVPPPEARDVLPEVEDGFALDPDGLLHLLILYVGPRVVPLDEVESTEREECQLYTEVCDLLSDRNIRRSSRS